MAEVKLYICKHCGNIIAMVHASGVPVVCCGEAMSELIPNTVDASLEKHVPVVQVKGSEVYVKVGSALHPMTAEHYIQWICLETKHGFQFKYLAAGDSPEAAFAGIDDAPRAVYAYCNLHGLWTAKL